MGVVLSGGVGFGKTAILEQLVEHSCFAEGRGGLVYREGMETGSIDLKKNKVIYVLLTYKFLIRSKLQLRGLPK